MSNHLKEATPEMIATVNKLKQTDFENATQEEIETYARFSSIIALHEDDIENRREIRQAESEERRELARQQAESAMNALDALAELAKAKLKAVENG